MGDYWCPYGQCTMRNLCKGAHCVREELEKDGWIRQEDGTLKEVEKNAPTTS